MRKIIVILLIFTMIMALCACGAEERQNPAPADEAAPEVVTQIIEAPSTTDDGETAEAPAERAAFGFDTKTVTLNSGHTMPILGIGTYALSDEQAENSVYWALRDGYRLIDTARIYGNESGVGRGIQRAINEGIVTREDIFVTTKMWTSDYDDGERAIEASLQRLGLDYPGEEIEIRYYTRFISSREDWELVDVYADEGLTGMETKKRDDFNRMIADCRDICSGVYVRNCWRRTSRIFYYKVVDFICRRSLPRLSIKHLFAFLLDMGYT